MTDTATGTDWVGADYRDLVTSQSYGQPRIDGVGIVDAQLFSDEGGDFCEVARLTHDGSVLEVPGFRPAQVNYSVLEPGAIKAWHLHRKQDDLWFVPPAGRVLIGLLDVREDSQTYQSSMRLAMGTGKPQLLFVPRGVAHGIANLGTSPASLLYFVSQTFDAHDPDEHRLPYDLLGADFWSIQPG